MNLVNQIPFTYILPSQIQFKTFDLVIDKSFMLHGMVWFDQHGVAEDLSSYVKKPDLPDSVEWH